jgi:polyribonucleotide nucleotidyltransferase
MAKPLLKIHCITEPYCQYPVAVRITMDDGTVQTYSLDNKMEYKFDNLLKKVKKSVEIGYQYSGRHEKKNRIHRHEL